MKTNPQVFIILMVLIIKTQAGETYSQQNEELKPTVTKDLQQQIILENPVKIFQVEIIQEVITTKDLKEDTTDLKVPETKEVSNITENLEITKILNNENENKTVLSLEPQDLNITLTLNSTESSEEEATTTSVNNIEKPLISLEEYALKQMNFILDYLLIETQDFVAKVLQASINTVFQRDNLKRYAEGLNNLLNPDTDVDYSDEIIMENKNLTQDELYEEIIHKLNFLKSKPTKYLQRQLPADWIKEYQNKRSELTIWLDKASEQMHQEFNRYVSQEEDHIKYQYFNEAFDDITRATEIHQKLALLADLVKIVKNKKQITFMDLYMQT